MVFLEPPRATLGLLRAALASSGEDGDDAPAAAFDFGSGGGGGDDDDTEEVLAYVATLASALASSREWDAKVWSDELTPYLLPALLPPPASGGGMGGDPPAVVVSSRVSRFRDAVDDAANHGTGDDPSDEEDEYGGEQITDIRFSLAYGGKILLHQTKLRLRRGHRYALVGQNGVGKTTLMNAINNGKLDGWPGDLRTEYVDSGSNVDPVHEARVAFDHLVGVTGGGGDECRELLKRLEFTDAMMSGTIGELSGGWQMKLRLAQAVLIDADILLLDEPTNHLDAKTVRWLVGYLAGLTHTTVLIVSHDTHFMEEVCSDGECFFSLSLSLSLSFPPLPPLSRAMMSEDAPPPGGGGGGGVAGRRFRSFGVGGRSGDAPIRIRAHAGAGTPRGSAFSVGRAGRACVRACDVPRTHPFSRRPDAPPPPLPSSRPVFPGAQ